MKAIILAAGYATRLGSLAINQPKHLLQVNQKYILDYSIEKIDKVQQIDQIYLITNANFSKNFTDWKANSSYSKPIKIISNGIKNIKNKLGAIGDLNFVIQQESIDEDILVIAADNIFEFELSDLIKEFEKNKKCMLAVYDVQDKNLAKLYGIVEVNNTTNNIITNFIEKPKNPNSTLASTGIYLFPKDSIKQIKQYLDAGHSPDRPGDYIAWLHKQEDVLAYSFSGKWFDIGDQTQLKEADDYFKNLGSG